MRIILIFSLLLLVVSGCDINDPKVQGAKQLERLLEEGNKRALEESIRLSKEEKDFILDTSNAEICLFESSQPHTEKTELGSKIQKSFEGKIGKDMDLYASNLPVGTKVYYEIKNSTQYRYAEETSETDKIYRCQQFFPEIEN